MMITKKFVERVLKKWIVHHENIIKQSGGHQGIRYEGGIYSLITKFLEHKERYVDKPFERAAIILKTLASNQYFVDGNKRSAYTFAKAALLENGLLLKPGYNDAFNFVMKVANNLASNKEIIKWLKDNSVRTQRMRFLEIVKK
ncbi:MAG: type II toxin-antitoxin system death-on-curing family toxin [Candidatus Aenigmarchaeota archaeon]|nr:type II toxin-antitoxin system death-on-curing family toxin [Candidatus Aenigmarchaeota archaeon]